MHIPPLGHVLVTLVAVAVLAPGCITRTTPDFASRSIPDPALAAAPTPVPIATETGEPAPADVDLAAIYEQVSRSIVFIETDDKTSGTGIVLGDGWILTNAHVVERFQSVRIGRSDGRDLGKHPVVGLDWIFDLAIVGPVDDAELEPFERIASSDLAIGDTVMLMGFPDESTSAPTPTLTSGIVSRRRWPALGDFPFVQVDATIAPGQSGGALIDAEGQLVGISGIEFGRGEFGLAFEADPMWPRVDQMLALPGVSLPSGPPEFTLRAEVGPRRNFGFLLDVDETGELDLLAVSDDDIFVDLQSLGGLTIATYDPGDDPFVIPVENGSKTWFVDDLLDGGEELIGTVDPGTYQVVIGSFGEAPKRVSVTSRNELREFADVEELADLPVGELVEGEFDWARDSDRWQLALDEGAQVSITADGLADTLVAVRFNGDIVASSDDESIGMFGTGSQLEFTAESSGVYEVEIGTFDEVRWGYLVQVDID